ncbi:MAG: 16S rRNA (cytidine(1402)-2'-O)-methyltransferase [Burkholderiales bacterium]|nr:16S rRNA (cytidine(1402)-2'-O)-methyltransferase [Burkholderiales bacterium]
MLEHLRRPALYVVATPIGNLGDVSARALEILRSVDLIAAEDTRVTGALLAHFGIDKPMLAVHQHNERRALARVLAALGEGHALALAADAGTPAISDPGAILVRAVRAAGHAVVPIPGPSALAAAWSVSGMSGPFLFYGFLPARPAERRRTLASLARLRFALVFYEAPHRVLDTALDLARVLGGSRRVALARELTKLFETVHECELDELADWLQADANRQRGEFVLIVSAASDEPPQDEVAEKALRVLLEDLAPAQAARLAARIAGVPRAALYERAVKLRGARGEDD